MRRSRAAWWWGCGPRAALSDAPARASRSPPSGPAAAECIVSPIGVQLFGLLGVMSRQNGAPQTASRPFDARRDGFVMGEGAGFVLLEDADHARRRGAVAVAELAGYGTTCDAYRVT